MARSSVTYFSRRAPPLAPHPTCPSPKPQQRAPDTPSRNVNSPPKHAMGSSQSAHAQRAPRPVVSDADLLKHTGKTRAEFDAWRRSTPGVGANQLAGKTGLGPAPGLGGGIGGWGGLGANESGPHRGMKFPPGGHDAEAVGGAEPRGKPNDAKSAMAGDAAVES